MKVLHEVMVLIISVCERTQEKQVINLLNVKINPFHLFQRLKF